MFLFLGITALFLIGIFFNAHFFWCHWLGFTELCFLYQRKRQSFLKSFLIPCWLVFFVVYAAYLYWLLSYKFWVYLLCTVSLSLLLPALFLLHYLLTQKMRSSLADIATVFGIFLLLELVLSCVPFVGTAPFDLFFHPSVEILRILHFIDFKIWSAWVISVCFMAALLIHKQSLKIMVLFFVSLAVTSILIVLANAQVNSEKGGMHRSIKIALIQHNLPFSEEWRIDHSSEVKRKYEALALEAAKQHPDLIVFPQYSFSEDIYRKPDFFTKLARKSDAYILTGAHVPIWPGKSILDYGFMNLALLFIPEGKIGGVYQAMAAPPFGEMIQQSAKKYRLIETPFGKLGVLLCYEDVTPQVAKEARKAGAEILIALSNPGLFTNTHLPYYYLQQDQLRVMETGLPLVRVSPNGYSVFIDKTGQITQKTQLNKEKILYININH